MTRWRAKEDEKLTTDNGRRTTQQSGICLCHVFAAVLVACFVSILFYSSFFAHWRGAIDSFRSYLCYLQRAGEDGDHVYRWYYYLKMLAYARDGGGPVWTEAFIMVLALVGCVGAVVPKHAGFADAGLLRFLALYTLFLMAAYSIIPYKTPWCLLSFLHGMILLAGVGAVSLAGMFRGIPAKVIVCIVLTAGCLHLAWQAYLGNFRYYADSRNPYVYAHTSTDFLKLVKRVNQISEISPDGKQMLIEVVTNVRDAWPLPWYLRGFRSVGYWSRVQDVPEMPEPSVIIVSPDNEEALKSRLSGNYQAEYYGLRPDVLLAVYIRSDLWEAFLKTREMELEQPTIL